MPPQNICISQESLVVESFIHILNLCPFIRNLSSFMQLEGETASYSQKLCIYH